MIDTHAHLDFKDFDLDRDQVIQRAQEAGVSRIINVGSSLEGSRRSAEISNRYPNVFNVLGLHPHEASLELDLENSIRELRKLVNKKTVAIGEIGLDYFNLAEENLKDKQKELFLAQLDLAYELNLPVVLHCREAYEDMLQILQKSKIGRGVVHCFSGNQKQAKEFLSLGLKLSFTGIVTYPSAQSLRDVVKEIGIDKIMIETDCPLLAPQDKRGTRNEPAYVIEIAQKIAEIKGISIEKVGLITDSTAKEFFTI